MIKQILDLHNPNLSKKRKMKYFLFFCFFALICSSLPTLLGSNYPQRGNLSDLNNDALNLIYEMAREQDIKSARVFGKIVRIPVQPLEYEPDYVEMMDFKRECSLEYNDLMKNRIVIFPRLIDNCSNRTLDLLSKKNLGLKIFDVEIEENHNWSRAIETIDWTVVETLTIFKMNNFSDLPWSNMVSLKSLHFQPEVNGLRIPDDFTGDFLPNLVSVSLIFNRMYSISETLLSKFLRPSLQSLTLHVDYLFDWTPSNELLSSFQHCSSLNEFSLLMDNSSVINQIITSLPQENNVRAFRLENHAGDLSEIDLTRFYQIQDFQSISAMDVSEVSHILRQTPSLISFKIPSLYAKNNNELMLF